MMLSGSERKRAGSENEEIFPSPESKQQRKHVPQAELEHVSGKRSRKTPENLSQNKKPRQVKKGRSAGLK